MISNERPSPYGSRGYGGGHSHSGHSGHSGHSHKPAVVEDTLRSDKVQIERKTFLFTLKENPRGRFLRITEDVNKVRMYLGPALLYGINLVTLFIMVVYAMLKVDVRLTLYSLLPLPFTEPDSCP